ncbi:MAG TPA: APC family permease [Jiangellaceae bacterium]|nr:APC family permease [Jiangellaceae bacterium]
MGEISKRLLVGRRSAADHLQQRLPKRVALPIYSSDTVSSVAYATQELLVVLTLGGLSALYLTPWAAAGVVVLMVVVVAAYRRLVQVYPNGGGDYEPAVRNLGEHAGLVTGGAMLTALVLTIAVAVAAAVDNLISAFPTLDEAGIALAVGTIVVLGALNLRGLRATGLLFAVPTYLFVAGVAALTAWGLARTAAGDTPVAESAELEVAAELGEVAGLALVLLAVRAAATGGVALTGLGTIVSAVPTFRKPRRKNAATTLLITGALAAVLFVGVTALAVMADVRYAADPCDLVGFDCAGEPQRTVIAQVAAAVFGDGAFGFYVIQLATVLILLLAANTAFDSFPLLGSIMAQHRHLPRQLHHRGDRHAFRNAVIVIAVAAAIVVTAFEVSVTRLVPLYVASVFLSFTLGQTAMVRYWNRQLSGPLRTDERSMAVRARALSAAAAVLTSAVVLVVGVTGFTGGVWVVLVTIAALYLVMRGIRNHYQRVETELAVDGQAGATKLPSRVHAIVLVSRLHKPTMRALAYARSGRPDLLEAVTVNIDLAETRALTDEWDRRGIPIPLKVLDSPYREINGPVVEYVNSIRRESPRDLVVVYIPEYVLGRWWEQLLHNKSALRLRARLMFTPGVMVTMVPWQLHSSTRSGDQPDR